MSTNTATESYYPYDQDEHGAHEGDSHYRVLPHNLEAEQGLLGALLVDNRAYEKIGDFIKPEHFYSPAHQRIFTAVQQFIDRGQIASPVTLKGYFEKDADLKDVGGAAYLADLAASIVSTINTEAYGRTIYDLHMRRELIALGEEVVNGLRIRHASRKLGQRGEDRGIGAVAP